MTRPNILWICTDQQRSDGLGCYGNSRVRSPNIDSIARNGTRFSRHITPMQSCSPSRATLMTGFYPRHHQLITNGRALPESVPTVASLLSAAGYCTHGIGKQHLQPLLAPAALNMPDSSAFWSQPESNDWVGPYYGFQTTDMLLGESDTAQLAGHYANWLKQNHPEATDLLKPEHAREEPPADLDEIWRSAMPVEAHYNTWISHQAVRFIEQEADQDTPFLLYVSYPDPHHPFDPPANYADRYDPEDIPIPVVAADDLKGRPPYCEELYPKGRWSRQLYWAAVEGIESGTMLTTEDISDRSMKTAIAYTYAMIEMIDDGVGEILSALGASGFAENTIVIFASDHGDYLGDHGLLHKGPASYRQVTEVPLVISGPRIQAGRVVESLTSHIDVAPTLLALTGTDPESAQFDGLSLAPLLSGEATNIRQVGFGEYHPTVRPELYNQTIYTDKLRYTIYPDMPEWGELFDLRNDPGECANLYFDAGYRDIREELGQVLANDFSPQPTVENRVICKW